jgi:hypothetical protein
VNISLALSGVVTLGACEAAKHKAASSPSPVSIAIGAFHPMTIEDACPGGQGKLDFCQREKLVRIDQVRVSPAGVVEVHPVSDVPSAMRQSGVDWVLLGVGAGRAAVTIEGTFDDGSRRSAHIEVTAARAQRAVPMIRCLSGSTPIRFPIGDSVRFHLKLLSASGTELAGAVPDALTGPGLSPVPALRATTYDWRAPESSGDVTFTSRGLPGFRLVLGSYQPADVTIVGGTIDRAQVPNNGRLMVHLNSTVRGEAPCAFYPFAVTTQTPAVCTGPNGETSFVTGTNGDAIVRPVTSGTCRLNVSVVGGSASKEIEVAYELLP